MVSLDMFFIMLGVEVRGMTLPINEMINEYEMKSGVFHYVSCQWS